MGPPIIGNSKNIQRVRELINHVAHTGLNTVLTGSGQFTGVDKTYENATIIAVSNPTPHNPRFGGFPGTDGFSYGGAR